MLHKILHTIKCIVEWLREEREEYELKKLEQAKWKGEISQIKMEGQLELLKAKAGLVQAKANLSKAKII